MPSTVILKASYDRETQSLTIVFVSGMVYNYKKVPEEKYEAMITSEQKEIYFSKHIKTFDEFEKVETE